MTQLVLFQGLDASNQYSLWVTDGTAAGTKELPVPGGTLVGYYNHQYYRKYGLFPDAFTPYGDKVLFRGLDAQSLYGLWVTDGTAAGTTELQVAGTSSSGRYGFNPGDFTLYKGKVLFTGSDVGENRGLWVTDGTAAGTTELQVTAGVASSGLVPLYLTLCGDKVLFNSWDASEHQGLWVTDGTVAGTMELQVAGANSDYGFRPSYFTPYGGKVLFSGWGASLHQGLWVSDGTAAGTTELQVAGASSPYGLSPTSFTPYGGKVLFAGNGASGYRGLWATDGTAAGTAELQVAGASSYGLDPSGFTLYGGKVLFSGRDASNLYGLWVTDGTAAGTTELQVADANSSGGDGLSPTSFAVADLQGTTSRPVPHDVNGDGRGDIVWQNQNGAPSVWAMQGGGDTVGAYLDYANPGPSWRLVGSADLNGDGRADLLWQNSNGLTSAWIIGVGGGSVASYPVYSNPGPSWRLVGGADLDGNGRADLLWQNSQTGAVSAWMMALGGTEVAAYVNFQNPGTSSHLIGGGDLSGDGKADLVFQDDSGTVSAWLMGGSVGNPSVSTYAGFNPISNPSSSWRLVGMGDLNGDGRDDLLFQNTDGTPSAWLVDQQTTVLGHPVMLVSDYPTFQNPGPSWHLKGATDANGDGRADLVWQNDSGLPSLWIMGAGGTSVDSYPVFANPGASWHVV